ncbi:hypothetical protein ACS7SF_25615 (plasmid) [Ralstonia sp. 25C]|uniref:hypothetical protein n=1 Tax=Ralstonia sp. 25C TaxID=3447363 RepID=UPI003F7559DC
MLGIDGCGAAEVLVGVVATGAVVPEEREKIFGKGIGGSEVGMPGQCSLAPAQ